MALVDEIDISVRVDLGGRRIIKKKSEKGKPRGGPAGGNGGRGGDVYLVAVRDLEYLKTYRYTKKFEAESGVDGAKNNRHGRNGEDLDLRVPVGSVVTNTDTGETYEFLAAGERVQVLSGGAGGYGNTYFKGPANRRPQQATQGKKGGHGHFHIELKLIADAGLIGQPSAGKSTLLNVLTNAQSAVGAYPFTTLEPHLGVFHKYVLADIPGLIEGASTGKGLGHKFLRHVKRTRFLLHLVSVEQEHPLIAYQTIRDELGAYDSALLEKDEIIVLSKVDLIDTEKQQELVRLFEKEGKEVWRLSTENAATLDTFTSNLSRKLNELGRQESNSV